MTSEFGFYSSSL